MGHFGESHLAPFRNSLVFSRRQRLQSAPVYRAMFVAYSSDPAPLGRAAAIVRNRCDVLDRADLKAGRLERPDGGLAARARALHEDIDLAHAVLHRPARGGLGRHLGGERRGLTRALEADLAGRGPRDNAAARIGDRDNGVVERALDVGVPVGDVLSFLPAHFLDAGTALGRHPAPLLPEVVGPLMPGPPATAGTARGLLLALPGTGIGLRALAVHGQPAAMPDALVAPDLDLAPNVGLHLAAQVAFDLVRSIDPVPQPHEVLVAEVMNAGVAADTRRTDRFQRTGAADSVTVSESDLKPLVTRQVDVDEACHPGQFSFCLGGPAHRSLGPCPDRAPASSGGVPRPAAGRPRTAAR